MHYADNVNLIICIVLIYQKAVAVVGVPIYISLTFNNCLRLIKSQCLIITSIIIMHVFQDSFKLIQRMLYNKLLNLTSFSRCPAALGNIQCHS